MLCGIVSQNVRCFDGAFGTVITQAFYTCTYVQITQKSIHYHHFVSIIDKNNRYLSGYDQITFICDDVPTRK